MASVNRTEWFRQAIKKDRWKEPGWITQLFCVTELTNIQDVAVTQDNPPLPFDIFASADGKSYCYWDQGESEFIQFDGSDVTEPLFKVTDRIKLNSGDIPNAHEPIDTNLGNVVINLYMLVYAFGNKFPFFTGKTDGGSIQKIITDRAVNPPENPDLHITAAEIDQYKKAVSALVSFAMIASASGSRASFTINKEVIELRDKLFDKYKDELSNPAVVADIEKQCVDLDISLRKGDVSDAYFAGDRKLQAVGRKKQSISYGLEGGLSGELTLIKSALNEGMNFEDIPLYADSSTAASQSRGLLTAQGGELVKYNLRMFQNSYISEDDCGTKGYIDFFVNAVNVSLLPTRHIFTDNGDTIMVTKAMAKDLIGKRIKLRSPGYCLTPGRNFCKSCVDANIAKRPNGIATTTSKGTSIIMNVAMKKMHGTVGENFDALPEEHLG